MTPEQWQRVRPILEQIDRAGHAAYRDRLVHREPRRHVEVKDLLVQTIRVHGRVKEDQRDRNGDEGEGQRGERAQAVIP